LHRSLKRRRHLVDDALRDEPCERGVAMHRRDRDQARLPLHVGRDDLAERLGGHRILHRARVLLQQDIGDGAVSTARHATAGHLDVDHLATHQPVQERRGRLQAVRVGGGQERGGEGCRERADARVADGREGQAGVVPPRRHVRRQANGTRHQQRDEHHPPEAADDRREHPPERQSGMELRHFDLVCVVAYAKTHWDRMAESGDVAEPNGAGLIVRELW
jgi:hypothetical protein